MDREQEEMQFLGVFDIFKESYKIIFTWRKIFTQITLSLVLPLSFIFLAHIQISNLIFANIAHDEVQLDHTRVGSPKYKKLNDLISSELAYLILFKFAYFTFFLVFSLLSTAAVVYTIACIYTARDVSFKKVMSVVPKVWKRLMVTFLCIFGAFFVYNIVSVFIVIIWVILLSDTSVAIISLIVFLVLYSVGVVYLTIIWQLASVVSVLEDSCGVKAMVKSRALINGKIWMASVTFFALKLCAFAIHMAFKILVVHGSSSNMVNRVLYGVVCLLLIVKFFVFELVIQTVIYFVCKSYHHENIDKSALSDHLEVYLGEYVPLKAKDVQLESFQV